MDEIEILMAAPDPAWDYYSVYEQILIAEAKLGELKKYVSSLENTNSEFDMQIKRKSAEIIAAVSLAQKLACS